MMSDLSSESVPRTATAAPTVEALLVDDATAALMLAIGTSYFRWLLKSGAIGPEPVRLGRRQLHRVDQLLAWVLAGLPSRKEWLATREGARR